MAQHDGVISNASGAAVRADLNNALAALITNSSGATSPATTYAFQFWADTTTGQLRIRNAANSAWITVFELDGTMLMEQGTASAPGLAFVGDLNTGIYRPAADAVGLTTGGAERFAVGGTEVVVNDPSNDVDFRVESNSNSHMLFVDAGNDRVGIGASAPSQLLELASTAPNIRLTDTIDGHSEIDGNAANLKFNADKGNAKAGSNISFAIDNDEKMRLDSSGNAVIGSTTSRAKLDVRGNVSFGPTNTTDQFQGLSFINGKNSATASTTSFIDFKNDQLVSDSHIFANHETNGSSNLVFGTTPAGSRTADRRVERVRVDSSGNVGIGTSTAFGKTHIRSSDSGITGANANADELVLDSSGNVGMTLACPNTGNGRINFADPDHQQAGMILYDHSTNKLQFNVNAAEQVNIDSSGNMNIGANRSGNPFTYLRFGASEFGAADVRPVNEGSHKVGLAFYTDGTADTTINPTEKVRIQAAGGISFNGDTAAANALDDYEEGTFTPAFQNGTFTYGSQVDGRYVKIGQHVTAHYLISWSAKSGSGNLVVNLPFATGGNTHSRFCGAIGFLNGIDNNGNRQLIATASGNGSTAVSIYIINDNASSTNSLVQNLSSSGEFQMSISFIV